MTPGPQAERLADLLRESPAPTATWPGTWVPVAEWLLAHGVTLAAPVPSRVVQGSVSTDQPLYAPLSDEACDAVIVAVAPQISDYAYALGYGEHFGTVRAARALIREIVASLPKEWHEGNESPEWIAKLERFRKSVTPPRTSEAP